MTQIKQQSASESVEQQELFRVSQFYAGRHPDINLMYHIPNEGKRTKTTGARLKREGLRPGFPDICLPVARGKYHSLYIELKTTGGKLSDKQKEWLYKLSCQGHFAAACWGYEQALQTVLNYLNLKAGMSYETIYPDVEWHNWKLINKITF